MDHTRPNFYADRTIGNEPQHDQTAWGWFRRNVLVYRKKCEACQSQPSVEIAYAGDFTAAPYDPSKAQALCLSCTKQATPRS